MPQNEQKPEREPGWYAVRFPPSEIDLESKWQIAYCHGKQNWNGLLGFLGEKQFAEIGPRLYMPGDSDPRDAEIAELRGERNRWKRAEQDLSAAYVQLRCLIPGALDTPTAPTHQQVWSTTEQALRVAIAELTTHRAELAPQSAMERAQTLLAKLTLLMGWSNTSPLVERTKYALAAAITAAEAAARAEAWDRAQNIVQSYIDRPISGPHNNDQAAFDQGMNHETGCIDNAGAIFAAMIAARSTQP